MFYYKKSRIFIIAIIIILFGIFVSSQDVTKTDNNDFNSSNGSITKNNDKKDVPKSNATSSSTNDNVSKDNSPKRINETNNKTNSNSSSNNNNNTSKVVNNNSNNNSSKNSYSSTKTLPNNSPSNNSVSTNTPRYGTLPDYLSSINFMFLEPKNDTIINPSSAITIKWECNISYDINRPKVQFILQSFNKVENDLYSGEINLNTKEYRYPVGLLNKTTENYILKLFTNDFPTNNAYYNGPILKNSEFLGVKDSKTNDINLSQVKNETKDDNGPEIRTRVILIAMITVLIIAIIAVVFISMRNKKGLEEGREYKEYQEYKGYSNVSPSVNKLLGINDYYDEREMQQQKQLQYLNNSSNTSTQSINTLAEQLYKAEQVYNNKVFKNPNPNENDEHCAPLVDMSSLYKSTQEILNRTKGTTDDDIAPDNFYYNNRNIVNQKMKPNLMQDQMQNQRQNNDNKGSNNGIFNVNAQNKEEESFLLFEDNGPQVSTKSNNNNNNNNNNNSFRQSDSINNSKILNQSTSFSMTNDSDNNERIPVNNLQKPFNNMHNIFSEKGGFEDGNTTDEDYVNKNSFCNNSKDSIDVFESIYINKQNECNSDSSALMATISTVEEYLASHRVSKELRHTRSSSLISSSSSFRDSIIGNNNFNVVPNMTFNNKFNMNNEYVSSPLKPQESALKVSENTGVRVSGSSFTSSAAMDTSMNSMNSSLMEELNSLEKQIQQQKQQMYHTQQLNKQDIDPNQLNLQMANLQQQGIENDQYLPSFPITKMDNNNNNNNKYTVPLSTPLSFIATPTQGKGLATPSPSTQSLTPPSKSLVVTSPSIQAPTTPQLKMGLNSPYAKSPNGKLSKNLKNGTELLSDNIVQKSQESESTLQVQQATQDTVSADDNDDEVETIVATHVCKAWYSPTMPDELRMCPGDELIILERFNDGWGFGQNTKGSVGVFPLDCVKYIDYNNINKMNNYNNNGNNSNNYKNNNNNNTDSLLMNNYSNNSNKANRNNIDVNGNYTNYNNIRKFNNDNKRVQKDYGLKKQSNLNPNYNLNRDVQSNKAVVFDTNDLYNDDINTNGMNNYFDYYGNNNMNKVGMNQPKYYMNYKNSPSNQKNMMKNSQNKYGGVTFNNMPNQYY